MAWDVSATIAALHALDSQIQATAKQVLGQGAAYAVAVAKSTTTFKDRSGSLRGSIHREAPGPWQYRVIAGGRGARHALFVEAGTKAHEIRPKRVGTVSSRRSSGRVMPRLLCFQIAGRWIRTPLVRHPGTKATLFMLDARNRAEVAVGHFIEAGMRAAIGA